MLLTALLLACSTEYGLSSLDPAVASNVGEVVDDTPEAAPPPTQELGEPMEAWSVVPDEQIDAGSARQTRVLQGEPIREDAFTVGRNEATLTDVLFVVDNSVSMRAVLDQLDEGLAALTAEGVFPPRTRIAVTSTTPRAAFNPSAPHEAVSLRSVVRKDPGFAGLVDGMRLQRFREANGPGIQERMPLAGCDAWFAPTATVPGSDVSCLMAHTQIAETPHGVEAGLVALGQLFAHNDEVRPRPGASFNVVFISDTHDPGVAEDSAGYDDLVALQPDVKELSARMLGEFEASGFRMHAIAPAEGCSGEPWTGTSYFDAAEATGGMTLDVCTAEPADYVALAQRIAELGSRPQAPVVALSAQAEAIQDVTVDGEPVSYSVGLSGRSIQLDEELTTLGRDVRVRYRQRRNNALPSTARGQHPAARGGRR